MAVAVGAAAAAFVVAGRAHGGEASVPAPPRSVVTTYAGRGSDGGRITVRYDSGALYWALDSPYTRSCRPARGWMTADTTWDYARLRAGGRFSDSASYTERTRWEGRAATRVTRVRLGARRTESVVRGSYSRVDAFFRRGRLVLECSHRSTFALPRLMAGRRPDPS